MAPSIDQIFRALAPVLIAALPEAVSASGGCHIWLFCLFFLLRFVRTAVNAFAFSGIRDACLPKNPRYSSRDVTVVLPTVLTHDICRCLHSILGNDPRELLLVVPRSKSQEAINLIRKAKRLRLRLLYVPEPSKRAQMLCGLKGVQTAVTVFADDDVDWMPGYLDHLLSAFEDPQVGAAGTNQRVIRSSNCPSFWNMLGISYIERRNFDNFAVNRIDGSVSTLSGRTCAYRTGILQTPAFAAAFLHDSFFGAQIKIGDDKMLTRWVFSRGWKIRLVWTERAVLYTTLDSGMAYLYQCIRWSRSHWQGNLAVVKNLGTCDYFWQRHPWGFYSIYLGSLMTPALFVDGGLSWLLKRGLKECRFEDGQIFWILTVFWLFTFTQKTIKMWPHFRRHPQDIWAVPGLIIFSYLHGFINLFALCTMCSCNWGNRQI